jgi:hypothetical protein
VGFRWFKRHARGDFFSRQKWDSKLLNSVISRTIPSVFHVVVSVRQTPRPRPIFQVLARSENGKWGPPGQPPISYSPPFLGRGIPTAIRIQGVISTTVPEAMQLLVSLLSATAPPNESSAQASR